MRFDLVLVPFGATYAQMRTAALAAEEAGFDGLWTWDHLRVAFGSGDRVPECWTVLSALAEATRRIQLGPLVLNVINRRPGVLANMAATLQEVSGGRLLLGLGAGGGQGSPFSLEQEALGEIPEHDRVRAERVAETAHVVRLLWESEAPAFEGRYYRLRRPRGFLRPLAPPPIVIAGFGPRMAAVAGRYGDGFNTRGDSPNLPRLIEIARREREVSGRDLSRFEISLMVFLREALPSPGSAEYAELERLGVGRLIFNLQPPYPLEEIRRLGARLRAAR